MPINYLHDKMIGWKQMLIIYGEFRNRGAEIITIFIMAPKTTSTINRTFHYWSRAGQIIQYMFKFHHL